MQQAQARNFQWRRKAQAANGETWFAGQEDLPLGAHGPPAPSLGSTRKQRNSTRRQECVNPRRADNPFLLYAGKYKTGPRFYCRFISPQSILYDF